MIGSAQGNGLRRRAACGLSAAVLMLTVAPQSRAELAYDILAGVGETDNVRLTPTDKRSDTIATAGFDLTWEERRRTYDADVTADVQYLDFLRHSYSGEVVGNVLGNLHLILLPQVLRWTVSENFGQSSIDPAAASTPNNRENLNNFSTGPDLSLPLGPTDALLVNARYSNVKYQVSDLSSNRYSAGVGARHELSAASGVSLNVQDELIRFADGESNPDYDQQEAYIRYDATGARTRMNFDVGYTRLKLPTEQVGGLLARLEVTRQLSPSQSVTFTAGHDYSDAGTEFVLLQALGGANLATQAIGASSSPFKQNYVTVGWAFQARRTGFGLDAGHFKLVYEESNLLDEQRSTAGAHITRQLTPKVQAGLSVSYLKEEFRNLGGGNYNQLDTIAQVTYRINTKLTVDIELARTHRDSDLASQTYTDDRAWLKFKYGRALPPPTTPIVPKLPPFPSQQR
jgi:hypothetical protein